MMQPTEGRTASDEVRDSYYGMPVIKAPHWRWLIIIYFFLGGLAGGGFTISALAELFGRDRAVARAGRYVSMAALIPSPVLLIMDLGRPERFLNMLRIFKVRSPMSLGTWALSGLGLFASASAALQLLADLTHQDILPGPRRLLSVLGLPFSIFVSGYTGVLLAATNVPLWSRFYPLLSPTFVASAFSTSLASISIILGLGSGERPDTARRVARAEAICLATEATLLFSGLVKAGKFGRPLRSGRWSGIFWPVTVVSGLLTPLLLQLTGPVQGKDTSQRRRTTAALLALIGGFSLRTVMIFAGRESANRPEYYFEATKAREPISGDGHRSPAAGS